MGEKVAYSLDARYVGEIFSRLVSPLSLGDVGRFLIDDSFPFHVDSISIAPFALRDCSWDLELLVLTIPYTLRSNPSPIQ